MKRYEILHNGVLSFTKGEVVSRFALIHGRTESGLIERLIAQGAVREAQRRPVRLVRCAPAPLSEPLSEPYPDAIEAVDPTMHEPTHLIGDVPAYQREQKNGLVWCDARTGRQISLRGRTPTAIAE